MARAGPGEWALQHSGTGRCPAAPSQHTLQQCQCSVRRGWHAQGCITLPLATCTVEHAHTRMAPIFRALCRRTRRSLSVQMLVPLIRLASAALSTEPFASAQDSFACLPRPWRKAAELLAGAS